MSALGTEILFVLPRPIEATTTSHVKLVAPDLEGVPVLAGDPNSPLSGIRFFAADVSLDPYARPSTVEAAGAGAAASGPARVATAAARRAAEAVARTLPGILAGPGAHYSGDLFGEIERYAALACQIAEACEFDVIHAHDWMTYPAAMAVARLTAKPLVVHVHSTEFDRSGEHINQRIYEIERAGMHAAQRVIAVSHLTRKIILARYGLPPQRVQVVYNAIDNGNGVGERSLPEIGRDEKIVLFLGRVTMQKGPEYFVAAAKRVLEVMDNVRFILAGSGDMIRRMIELAAEMGIGHKVLFTGFLRGADVERAYRMADLYVMPSVSEPFGLAALEALSHNVPVLISKQSGVGEILHHALKVDFWDIDEMANKIIAVLRHPPLHATLRQHGSFEVQKLSWTDAARGCLDVYSAITRNSGSHV
jgi:glycosyltransferase involved in cell wall biosynthesis